MSVGGPRWRVIDGSVLFLDVSGFTPLTERLAARGKAGGEELTDHLNAVFGDLIAASAVLGGDVLKFGGDALLLLFAGAGHEARAAAAAWDMQAAMRPFARLRTSVGTVPLRASSGLASGPVNLFLAGRAFDDQVAAGPTVTACLELEKAAEATEVLVGPRTVEAIGPAPFAAGRAGGMLLVRRPDAGPPPAHAAHAGAPAKDPRRGLPAVLHDELGHSEGGEHRQGVVSFVQVQG